LISRFELGIHGKRKNFRSDFFGNREIPLLVSELFVGVLEMKRYGIVNPGGDFGLGKMLLKTFAVMHADNI